MAVRPAAAQPGSRAMAKTQDGNPWSKRVRAFMRHDKASPRRLSPPLSEVEHDTASTSYVLQDAPRPRRGAPQRDPHPERLTGNSETSWTGARASFETAAARPPQG